MANGGARPAARSSRSRLKLAAGVGQEVFASVCSSRPSTPNPAVVPGRRARVPIARDAARIAAPSPMDRSAAASPAPIARDRARGATTGDRLVTRAGEMTRPASMASRRILNSRATTDASTTSPSDSRLPPSGTAGRFAVARSVARAVVLESLRRLRGRRDDLCIALTPRPGPHHVSGAEHQQGREPHRSPPVFLEPPPQCRDRGARSGGGDDGAGPRRDRLRRLDVRYGGSDARGELGVTGRLDGLLETGPSA
jgi:hypothetical protein